MAWVYKLLILLRKLLIVGRLGTPVTEMPFSSVRIPSDRGIWSVTEIRGGAMVIEVGGGPWHCILDTHPVIFSGLAPASSLGYLEL